MLGSRSSVLEASIGSSGVTFSSPKVLPCQILQHENERVSNRVLQFTCQSCLGFGFAMEVGHKATACCRGSNTRAQVGASLCAVHLADKQLNYEVIIMDFSP